MSDLLLEKLGNLKKLNVGPMIDMLKQLSSGTPVKKRFNGQERRSMYSPTIEMGPTSEIIDCGVLKNGIAGLRKAYRENIDAVGFAIYVDRRAVMFGKFSAVDIASQNYGGLLAYDLTPFKDQIEKRNKENPNDDNGARLNNLTTDKKISARSGNFNKETSKFDDTIEVSREAASHMQASNLKKMIEEVIGLAGDKPITFKLVIYDKASRDLKQTRRKVEEPVQNPRVVLKKMVATDSLRKADIMKSILTMVKDGRHGAVSKTIGAAREIGLNYPEFNVIEKSMSALNKKNEGKLTFGKFIAEGK